MSIGNPIKKTFCPAPWFQIRNENSMERKCCCKIQLGSSKNQSALEYLNSPEMILLKKKLHSGERPSVCKKCWDEEDNGLLSQRQKNLGIITNNTGNLENTWLKSYFENKNDFESNLLLMADIKIGNTCNFHCVMCVPDDSSKIYSSWVNDKDSEFVKEYLNSDPLKFEKIKKNSYKSNEYRKYVDDILSHKEIKWLRFLGGEPLLDHELLKKLKNISKEKKNKLKLSFITNGSCDLDQMLKYIGYEHFNLVHFTVSLEGTDKIQEYARYGSNWNQIENNILKNLPKKNVLFNVGHVLQTTTVMRTHKLLEWCKKNQLSFSISYCYHPQYLSLKSTPKACKKIAYENISKYVSGVSQIPFDDSQQLHEKSIVGFLQGEEFDNDLYKKFVRYINWYEKDKNVQPLKELVPELFKL